jgi:integral membrane sensor domain MASE1
MAKRGSTLPPGAVSNLGCLSGRCSRFWRARPAITWRREPPGCCVFPDSKVSLFFPPHAILVSILLLVPTRHWWAYILAAVGSHFFATQQENWPPLYALQCEAFDAVKIVLTAAGIRLFIKSPFHLISLREAIIFVLIAVIIVPVGTAFWGAAFTVSNHFGAHYWVEWRNSAFRMECTTSCWCRPS